jgi:lysyl-tRNA synthetase class II
MAGTPIKRARHEKALAIMAKPDFWEMLWEHLAEGNTLRSFVSGSDVPYGVLWRKMQSDPVLMERYEIVRNARALANAERIEALAERVEAEQMDPNAAKVAMGREAVARRANGPEALGE